MLSVYTNQQDLLKSNSITQASRLESVDKELLDSRDFAITFKKGSKPNLELHVYTPDGAYLTGNHSALYSIESNDTTSQTVAYQHLAIDAVTELESLGITRGQYKIIYNLFDNIVGSFDGQKLWIKEVSPSRRELRIQLSDNSSSTLLSQYETFRNRWKSLSIDNIFDSFVINFGFNKTYQIINVKFNLDSNIPEFFVKLYEPLPVEFGEKAKLWISEEIINPILDSISIIPKYVPVPSNTLAPPNFELEEYDGVSIATDFKSWNELLAANLPTSQKIIDAQFSGSLSGIKLNINYRNFENFVHYSSAAERVKNFKYKLELLEYYSSQIQTISASNGGAVKSNNLSDLYTKRNSVVSAFDDFEKYLFFESTGSKIYTHNDPATGSIDPWPKQSAAGSDPYPYFETQVLTTSVSGSTYYDNLLETAEIYDRVNIHNLVNTIPLHIQNSEGGEEYSLFINMIAQHFDILWTYVKGLTSIQTREEHPKDGMSSDLLYHVAKSMGFELLNGRSASDLWKYSLGVDVSGSASQTNNNGITSIPDSDLTKEVWRRIVNNLPYILKTKGTSRSIKALLSCFGIPASVLTIKEYGGPTTFTDNDHYPEYVHDVYHYAWYSSSTGSLYIPTRAYLNSLGNTVYPDTLELRFKTDNNYTYGVGTSYSLLSTVSSSLTLTKESADDTEGTLTLAINGKSGSISNIDIFDNSWQQVVIETTNGSGSLRVAKSLYGKLVYLQSASFATGSGVPLFQQNLNFASGSNKLYGHFQEIRLWSGSLNDASIEEHSKSPNTYTFNVNRATLTAGSEASKPYDHLLQRFTLSTTAISSGSWYQSSDHPNQKINTGSVFFNGFGSSGSIQFEGFEETYYTPSPSLGTNTLYTNKVRIESSSVDSNKRLNTKTRVEKSSFDRYSIDSNRVGVYFSPQTAINEDIFNQLGYFEIDDYIGNPGDAYNDYYNDLNNFAINYWKKYENRNDFEAYFRALQIYDFTLFKYIKRLLPQRVNAITGIVVEPNVLERSKVKLLNKPTIEDLTNNAIVDAKNTTTISSEYLVLEAETLNTRPDLSSEVASLNSFSYDTNFKYFADSYSLDPSTPIFSGTEFLERTAGANAWNDDITVYFSGEDPDTRTTGLSPGVRYSPAGNTATFKFFVLSGSIRLSPSASFYYDNNGIQGSLLYPTASISTYSLHLLHLGNYYRYSGLTYTELTSTGKTVTLSGGTRTNLDTDLTTAGWEKNPDSYASPILYTKLYKVSTDASFTKNSGIIDNLATTDIDLLGTSWTQHRYIGKYKITENGKYTPIQTFVSSSRVSTHLQTVDEYFYSSSISASLGLYYSSSLKYAEINNFYGTGHENSKYLGSKLVGSAVNVNSTQTVDGGPVVKVTKVNSNQIIFAKDQVTLVDTATSGYQQSSI